MAEERLDMRALGLALTRRREALGWTTYRLAERAGITDPYVRELEKGNGKRVGVMMLAKLARALDTSLDELLQDAGFSIGPDGDDAARRDELAILVAQLTPPERRALLQMGQALLELRHENQDLLNRSNDGTSPSTLLGRSFGHSPDGDVPRADQWPMDQP